MGYGIITTQNIISLHEKLKRTDKIYHIFIEALFDEVIRTKTLRFAKVTSWKDPWEQPAKNIKKIQSDKDRYIEFIANTNNLPLLISCAGMCFCKQFDKEAMWQYYAYREAEHDPPEKAGQHDTCEKAGVCIETTVEGIIDSLNLEHVSGGFVGPVLYLDFSGENAKRLIVNENAETYPSYMYMGYVKRNNYEYEEEIRIILDMGNKISEDYVEIPCDIQKLVNKIYLSPGLSDEKIDSLRKKYCRLNVDIDISKLYSISDLNIPKLSDEEWQKVMVSGGLPENSDLLYFRQSSGEWVKK